MRNRRCEVGSGRRQFARRNGLSRVSPNECPPDFQDLIAVAVVRHTPSMPDSSSPLALANLFGLDGKVAVVTGGSRGIGYMIASGLVANGVRTYITARKADACDAAAAELSEHGECISFPADLSTADGLASFVDAAQPSVSRSSTSSSTTPVPPGVRRSASSPRSASTR